MTTIAVLVVLLSGTACRKEPVVQAQRPAPPAEAPPSVTTDLSGAHIDTKIELIPDVLKKAAIGTGLDAEGAVVADSSVLPARKPLYLTMWFRTSPPELQVACRWLDEKGNEVAVERRAANGEPIVTLTVDKGLHSGKYKVEGYWGGNLVFERNVTVK